jgi:polyferredoxin
MEKMGYARGLIRYSTTHGVEKKLTRRQMVGRVLRPRVLVYVTVLLGITLAMAASLWLRVPLKVDVIRDRAAIAREVEGMVENVYRLQIMNTTEAERVYELRVRGLRSAELAGAPRVEVDAASVRMVPVRVRVDPAQVPAGSHRVEFEVNAVGVPGEAVSEKSIFIVR